MKKHFIDLIKYNDWANQRILITLEEIEKVNEDILRLYSHTLTAQIVWFNRIKNIPTSPFPLWEVYNVRELKSMTEESSQNWMAFIQSHPNDTFEEMIDYKNSKGIKYESTLRQIVTHVMNHSTYHRGQIVSRLVKEGITAPITDYIMYTRE